MNDFFGNPNKSTIQNKFISPTSLRYLYHAYLILSYISKPVTIVEVGCGYGGLCLAINYLSKILNKQVLEYHCIDLKSVINLQQKYLSQFDLTFKVNFHFSDTFGRDVQGENLFLISNYCFSEISNENQQLYIKTLFPKITNGFIVWNFIPLYDFSKSYNVEHERPLTGSGNKFVYF